METNEHNVNPKASPEAVRRADVYWADQIGLRKANREIREEGNLRHQSRRRRDKRYEGREWPDDPTED